MAPDTRGFAGLCGSPRSTFHSKWDILFDKDAKEWIAFKPALGLHVYPCYSCRHMFYSKKSFLDHINRRAVVLLYKCPECSNVEMTFYNRCSFLLHCRKHYDLHKGLINLNNLEVSTLPFGLAGFLRHPDIPYLFDVEENLVEENRYMNAQFYAPKLEDKGKEIITLTPSHLIVNRTGPTGESQGLALKQVAKNIPKCQFISLQALRELQIQMHAEAESAAAAVEIKREPEESQSEQITFSDQPVTPRTTPERQQTAEPSSEHGRNAEEATGRLVTSERSAVNVEDLVLPIITKVETVEETLAPSTSAPVRNLTDSSGPPPLSSLTNPCPECQLQISGSLSTHFLGGSRPMNESLRCDTCKLICATVCSFKAHVRVHNNCRPYVCPDCGKEFPERELLMNHMDEVCFHMTKSVRFRCPGRRCGKIFASDATFGPHFKQLHIDTVYMCGVCREIYTLLEDCEEHCLQHQEEEVGNIVKLFSCYTCGDQNMSWHKLKKHIEFHCKDLSRCIYVFMCKFCKCYFRSVQTMATHLQNCKVQKTGVPRRVRTTNANNFIQSKYVSGQCNNCRNKIICLKAKPSVYCSKCLNNPIPPPLVKTAKKPVVLAPDKCVCILCKLQIDFEERRRHQQECKYAKPQILVQRLDLEKMMESINQLNRSFSSSNSDLDGSHDGSPQKNRGDSSDDNRPRKRHRPSKPKKSEMENDLTAEKPILFNGTYQCRLCEHKNTDREEFHTHVKDHRNISTAYQCMECGECFVVKPSLVKHLLHFHNISNSAQYFSENDCFDQGAVTELAKVVKAPYLANHVKENQCKVCMEQFEDSEGHDKHFRTHGMAFLMKNSI